MPTFKVAFYYDICGYVNITAPTAQAAEDIVNKELEDNGLANYDNDTKMKEINREYGPTNSEEII